MSEGSTMGKNNLPIDLLIVISCRNSVFQLSLKVAMNLTVLVLLEMGLFAMRPMPEVVEQVASFQLPCNVAVNLTVLVLLEMGFFAMPEVVEQVTLS